MGLLLDKDNQMCFLVGMYSEFLLRIYHSLSAMENFTILYITEKKQYLTTLFNLKKYINKRLLSIIFYSYTDVNQMSNTLSDDVNSIHMSIITVLFIDIY